MNWIENLASPSELILAWQPSDITSDRFRWAVATLKIEDLGCVLRYLREGSGFEEKNAGKSYQELRKLGFEGHPSFDLRKDRHSSGVLEAFLRRLPPRGRKDFRDYLHKFRISSELELSSFSLLGLTEARLPSDGFSLVDPINRDTQICELMLEVAGYRHYVHSAPPIEIGDSIEISHEPENFVDSNAVRLHRHGVTIGYINRLQAPTFLYWLSHRNLSAEIERINGTSDRPRAFIFVKVRPLNSSRKL